LIFARIEKKLVGMVGAFVAKEPDNAHVIAVYVAPEVRGKGISNMLMNSLLDKLRKNSSIRTITVEVNPEQKAALNLYKSLGFKFIEEYKEVLGDGKEHNLYRLEILKPQVIL
jgi:ribosomal protein S18 acetylase RimI-like enzyme